MSKKTHVELVTEFGSKAVKRFPNGFQLDNIMDEMKLKNTEKRKKNLKRIKKPKI